MIITKITGGLGNQMFQYTLGRVLAVKRQECLKLDLSFYDIFNKVDAPRLFELDIFNTKYDVATRSECMHLSDSSLLISTINQILHTKFNSNTSGYIREKSKKFDPEVLNLHGDIYLDGFWQSEKYFKDYRDLILKDFTFQKRQVKRNQVLMRLIKEKNSVSIHVRRSDYVSNPATKKYHGTCDLNYYKKSLEYLKNQLTSPTFFIFSDDIDWCKKNLKISNDTNYISHNKGDASWEDMRLMSRCKHHIIANSSFSWWGAWLNNSTEKIVIAPRKWFNDNEAQSNDIVPSSWVKV